MEQPHDDFIALVVTLAKEDEEKQKKKNDNSKDNNNNNNNSNNRRGKDYNLKSKAKQEFKDYALDQNKVVSWLLFLIINGTYPTKSVKLLDRLLIKEGQEFIEELSEEILYAARCELIKILDKRQTDTFRKHWFGIIESFATYLVPEGKWNDLEPTLEIVARGEEDGTPLKDNSIVLLQVLSKHEFKKTKKLLNAEQIVDLSHEDLDKRRDALDTFNSFILSRGMSQQQFKSTLPLALSVVSQLDGISHGGPILDSTLYLTDVFINEGESWTQGFIPQIIDTFIKVMDRNRVKGFSSRSIKRSIFDFLLLIAEGNPFDFTQGQIEAIVVHMYAWLMEVKDVSVEEWTESNSKIDNDNNFFNFNYDEEQDDDIVPKEEEPIDSLERYEDISDEAAGLTADTGFDRLSDAFGESIVVPIFNQFTVLSKSQQWKERYAALISLSKVCKSIPTSVSQQFKFILKSALSLIGDENTRVRWASFQLLIKLSIIYNGLMIESREELFETIGKSISDPNERVQSCCCVLIQTIMGSLTKDMIVDSLLDGLFCSFEKLLGSSKLYVVESAFISLISVIGTVKEKFKPYYRKFIPIIFSLLEKHHGTKESRIVRSRAIKCFAMSAAVMDKKTYLKDLHWFMRFVKKNQKSFDLIVDVFRASGFFIEAVGKSFSVYLPMVMRMIINILRTPLPNQLTGPNHVAAQQDITKILSTLKVLNAVMDESDDGQIQLYEPLAPFMQILLLPLYTLTMCPIDSDIRDRSEKTLMAFGMMYDFVLRPSSREPDLNVMVNRINMTCDIIKVMGTDAMSFDQVQMTLATFTQVEKKLLDIAKAVRDNNEEVIGDRDPEDMLETVIDGLASVYEMIGEMIKQNATVSVPLVTSSGMLVGLCKKLRDKREDEIVKTAILCLLAQYCSFGGEAAIGVFPDIIPPITECLIVPYPMGRQNASYALGMAAQIAKDRFAPFVMQVLQGFNVMLSLPASRSPSNEGATENAISSIGRIVRYVPQVASHVNVVIPKWLSTLPIQDVEEIPPLIDNLYAIVHLYTDESLGQQFQHVAKIHQIIQHYMKTCQRPEKELLTRTWLFIKDSIQSNWDTIPEDTKDILSKLSL
ncbi:hypothetical protein DFA_00475 [Cavenderia fasciculata]|uniref:Uncharacterized protein n=1 Tax=Cavenderia fasciculata TaxID=261658 RepID=F4PS16_CACFS|nr:uncharacterized protein DFA_00475 [Cavenderia fasciculata]EGG20614.1 hypothetical protein DFA_00475 [Cavenderia fasciculata]|eukprot:XP_004358464.1 hypothetical protein DFA_00475 [Cavenderia fasciculata]